MPIILLLLAAFTGCSVPHPAAIEDCASAFIDKPISFSENRKALTLEYRRRHYDPQAQDIIIQPKMVVIHWTAINSLEASFLCLDHETLDKDRPDIAKGGAVNVSAHFLVDRDGSVYRLMPTEWMARHVIGLNHLAIGIENVGGPETPLTAAQARANAVIILCLKQKYPGITTVIGHHQYLSFKGTSLWVQRDTTYRAHKKIDPGDGFMTVLKAFIEKNNPSWLVTPSKK